MELLFNLPIWLLALMGVVAFGEMLSCVQQVSLASRVGAEEASRTASLPSAGQVPGNVLDALGHQLAASGLTGTKVILEHNAGKAPATLVSGNGPGDRPGTPLPSQGTYVRITVVARMNGLIPRLLQTIGLDFSSQLLRQSVTFRYVMPPTETR
jgi:hypothetical protein